MTLRHRLAGFVMAGLVAATPAFAQAKKKSPARPKSRPAAHARKTLDIYFVDVEGGQATLFVTPSGQSLLVDAGFPSTGTFESKPGDPKAARDPMRILAAARDAGISRIDYLVLTHFHADHVGGVPELSQLMPIKTFVDHDHPLPDAEENVPGTLAAHAAYAAVRARGHHVVPRVGSKLPIRGLDLEFVSTAGKTLARPMPGAGEQNAKCSPTPLVAQEPHENPRSTGFVLRFGKFSFLDVGDLTDRPLYALACPVNQIGPVDVYLVAHHGGLDAADPATLTAFQPRASIVDNSVVKGGTPEMLNVLRESGWGDVWQLHTSRAAGPANVDEARIANLDNSTVHWIKVSARSDGSFEVVNGRTGQSKTYSAR